MPGEWEEHEGCWIIWPERPDVWRNGAKPGQKVFVEVAKAIAEFEPVTMIVSKQQFLNARCQLPDHIRLVEMTNDCTWVRDCGPSFVKNDKTGEIRGVDWGFDAWGGALFPVDQSDLIPKKY